MAENAGRLFKNPKFTEGSQLPRYIGECEVDGVKKVIAAWVRKSKNGVPYLYVNFTKPKTQAQTITTATPTKQKNGIRKIEKIAAGKKEEKVKPADMEISDIPF